MTLRLSRQLPRRHPLIFNRNSRNRSPCNFPRGFNTHMLHSSCTFERIDEHNRHLSKDNLDAEEVVASYTDSLWF